MAGICKSHPRAETLVVKADTLLAFVQLANFPPFKSGMGQCRRSQTEELNMAVLLLRPNVLGSCGWMN